MPRPCLLRCGLFCTLVLSATSTIAINETYTFVVNTGPTALGRMNRDGISASCATPGPIPTVALPTSTFAYQILTVYNNAAARCVTLTVTTTCLTAANFIGINAYAPSVTSATRTGPTWLGDAGSSPNPSITFSFNAPANSPVALLVEGPPRSARRELAVATTRSSRPSSMLRRCATSTSMATV